MNMEDIKDIHAIRIFVDDFYSRVRKEALLGPIFERVIKDNWTLHLEKMYAFWNAVLFGEAGFRGNPVAKHAPLALDERHYDRWLELFNETIDQHFEGCVATDAKNRAVLMANMFLSRLQNTTASIDKIIV
jgi:hemoglobin